MKYFKYLFCAVMINFLIYPESTVYHQKMIVRSPIANLKGVPKDTPADFALPASSQTNPSQLTQLLFNEYLVAQKKYIDSSNITWYLVNAVQQLNKNNNRWCGWSGVLGWVKSKDVQPVKKFKKHNLLVTSLFANIYNEKQKKISTICIGTQLTGNIDTEKNMYQIDLPDESYGWMQISDVTPIEQQHELSESELRKNIIKTAQQFLGNLYSWGGRSPQTDLWNVSSVDCSGLVNLVFAAHGLLVPRNSYSQYLASSAIKYGKDLKIGDLIFFANSNNKINHVLLYCGDGKVLESSLTAQKVQESSFKKRIGFDHTKMKSGDLSGPIMVLDSENPTFFKIYFRSFLSHKNMLKKLKHDILRHDY